MTEIGVQNSIALVFVVQPNKKSCGEQVSSSMQEASEACQEHTGFTAMKSYPPVDGAHQHWTCVIEFDSDKNAESWLRSAAYEVFKNKLKSAGKLREQLLSGSMFSLRSGNAAGTPSLVRWKQCIVVVSMLLPLLLLIQKFWPHHWQLAPFYKTLSFSSIAVPIMIYLGNPIVGKYTSFWLLSNSKLSKWKNIGFTAAYIAGVLGLTKALVMLGVL